LAKSSPRNAGLRRIWIGRLASRLDASELVASNPLGGLVTFPVNRGGDDKLHYSN
jgi:hypothetical protein